MRLQKSKNKKVFRERREKKFAYKVMIASVFSSAKLYLKLWGRIVLCPFKLEEQKKWKFSVKQTQVYNLYPIYFIKNINNRHFSVVTRKFKILQIQEQLRMTENSFLKLWLKPSVRNAPYLKAQDTHRYMKQKFQNTIYTCFMWYPLTFSILF